MAVNQERELVKKITASLPSGTGAEDARTPGEAYYVALAELDLIEEGQEAAEHYTAAQVKKIRKWLEKHKQYAKG